MSKVKYSHGAMGHVSASIDDSCFLYWAGSGCPVRYGRNSPKIFPFICLFKGGCKPKNLKEFKAYAESFFAPDTQAVDPL